jgi:DNA-directed RNA polymerase specialized sigma24 family protein
MSYTRRRIQRYDSDRATLILDDFWVELLNARAICDFKGLSSLKTYLFKILNFRIVDNFRKANCKSAYGKNISSEDHEIDSFGSDDISPENDLMHKEKLRLVHETLLMLAETSPTDAYLVKLHLEGLDYRQMAEKSLSKKGYSEKELTNPVIIKWTSR